MQQKIFCKGCSKRLMTGILGFGGEPTVEFEDGMYCLACAKKIREQSNK